MDVVPKACLQLVDGGLPVTTAEMTVKHRITGMPIGWPRTAQLVEQGNNDRLRLLRLIREGTAFRGSVIKVGGAADVATAISLDRKSRY